MNNIVLPDALNDQAQAYDPIDIKNYCVDSVSGKNKVTLKQNVFAFLIDGYKTVSYADRCVQIDNTKFLLLSAGNCLMSEKLAAQNGVYQSTMLLFDNTALANFFLKYPHIVSSIKKRGADEDPFLVFDKDAFLNNFIASLNLLIQSGQTLSLEIKRLKFEELMLYLCGKYPEQVVNLRTSVQENQPDFEIRCAVESNIENNITVEELAFLCHTSVSTFKRRFIKIYGTSPTRWMIQKRMELAANLLKHGQEKPSDIYYKVGYENLSSFIQSFKQIYGMTPKEYQAQNLNV